MRKQWMFFAFIFVLITSAVWSAQARSFSNTLPGEVMGDAFVRTIFVAASDFESGAMITDLNVTIRFGHRHTATCEQTPSGFYGDLYYQLQGPDGTTINLINIDSYDFGLDTSYITVTLDDSAAQAIGGDPQSGTFRPTTPLATFIGHSPFGTWTLHVGDARGNGRHCFRSFTLDINTPAPDSEVDRDGDGLTGLNDNCPTVFNPDQEDGWGSTAGDACDTDWYNRSGQGLSAYVQKNGLIHLHGNCQYLPDGAPRCPIIAVIDPATLMPSTDPVDVTGPDANGWSVWVHYLHTTNGAAVYQINTFSSDTPQLDSLVDDRFEIHVSGDSWRWWHRDGSPASIISYYPLENGSSIDAPTPPENNCQPSRLSWISCAIAPRG